MSVFNMICPACFIYGSPLTNTISLNGADIYISPGFAGRAYKGCSWGGVTCLKEWRRYLYLSDNVSKHLFVIGRDYLKKNILIEIITAISLEWLYL